MELASKGVVALPLAGKVKQDRMCGVACGLSVFQLWPPVSISLLRLRTNRSSTISRGSSPVNGSNVDRNSATYSMELARSSNRSTPVSYTGRSRSISRLISANNTPFHVFRCLDASLHCKRKHEKRRRIYSTNATSFPVMEEGTRPHLISG